MIERPERQIEEFARAGADSHHLPRRGDRRTRTGRWHAIRELGCLAGIALNPGTPVEAVDRARRLRRPRPLHDRQPRLGRAAVHRRRRPDKVARLREIGGRGGDRGRRRDRLRPPPAAVAEAGASLFVAGSAVFGADDPAAAYTADRRRRRAPSRLIRSGEERMSQSDQEAQRPSRDLRLRPRRARRSRATSGPMATSYVVIDNLPENEEIARQMDAPFLLGRPSDDEMLRAAGHRAGDLGPGLRRLGRREHLHLPVRQGAPLRHHDRRPRQ